MAEDQHSLKNMAPGLVGKIHKESQRKGENLNVSTKYFPLLNVSS